MDKSETKNKLLLNLYRMTKIIKPLVKLLKYWTSTIFDIFLIS